MDFKDWLLTEEDTGIQAFLTWAGNAVLQAIQPGQGEVRFRFPNYAQYALSTASGVPQASQPSPMALAASRRLYGPLLGEGLNQDDPHGKGGLAYTAAKHMLPKWNDQQVLNFKVGMKAAPSKYGQQFGLLFEVEIFEYLVKKKQLSPVGENEFTAFSLEDSRTTKAGILAELTKGEGPALTKQFVQFIQAHAWTVAEQILQKTMRILRHCKVDSVEFIGGGSGWKAQHGGERANPADLILGCSSVTGKKRGSVGYSTKFTSEALVNVASMSLSSMYQMLGGEQSEEEKAKLDAVVMNFDKAKKYVVAKLDGLAAQYENQPEAFVKLLEHLITGGHDTFPVARLYIRSAGGAEWSNAFKMDFETSDNQRGKLAPKPGATVEVATTNSYVKMTYKVPGGTPYGTYIMLMPTMVSPSNKDADEDEWDMNRAVDKPFVKINVKVNNLGTDKFR